MKKISTLWPLISTKSLLLVILVPLFFLQLPILVLGEEQQTSSSVSNDEKMVILAPNDPLAPSEVKFLFSEPETPEKKALWYYNTSGGTIGYVANFPGGNEEYLSLLNKIRGAEHYSEKVKIIFDFENSAVKIPRDVAEDLEEYEILVLLKVMDYLKFVKVANNLDKVSVKISHTKQWRKKSPILKLAISDELKRFN